MHALAHPLRRLVADPAPIRHLAERLQASIARLLPVQADAATWPEADDEHRAARSQLRTATLVAAAAFAVWFLIEVQQGGHDALLLLRYGCHVLVLGFILVRNRTARGSEQRDRLALLLTLSCAANVILSLSLWAKQPGLCAGSLACLLMGSAVLFWWEARRMMAISGLICFGFAVVAGGVTPEEAGGSAFFFALLVLIIGATSAIASARLLSLLRARLARRETELASLADRLMSVQEEERRHLSRELHDEFGQSLSAAMAYLWLLDRRLPSELTAQRQTVADLRRLMTKTLGAMRELSHLLRPATLDEFGLVPSLEAHLKAFGKQNRIATSFRVDGLPDRLPAGLETALYRITQEALTNVARHARASRVRVELTARDGHLRLEIEDDGIGLRRNYKRAGIGLIGIRERVRAFGGSFRIAPGAGTRLKIWVPLSLEVQATDSPEVGDAAADRPRPADQPILLQ